MAERNRVVDVLVIGASPSGSVAAGYLNKQGIDVMVVEKGVFPRFIIGESLLPRSMEHFDEVGFIPVLEAQNFEVKRGARFTRDGVVCLFDFSKKHTDGWDWTWQVPRAEFDKCLTDELHRRGVPIHFGSEVVDATWNDGTWTVEIKDKAGTVSTFDAKYIIDCSGFGRVLATKLGLDRPSEIPKHSSIFTHVKDVRRPTDPDGTLISFDIFDDDTWMWSIPFSDDITSIGFVGSTEHLNSLNGSPSDKIEELLQLSERFQARYTGLEHLIGPYEVQNFSRSVSKLHGPGFVLAGNSAEFLDPVFSSGVAFSTESSLLAAKLIEKEMQGNAVDWEKEYVEHIQGGVNVFSTYVKEWYNGNLQKLFFHRPENHDIKRQICAVLAGYVWDESNPFVKKHQRLVANLAHMLRMEEEV